MESVVISMVEASEGSSVTDEQEIIETEVKFFSGGQAIGGVLHHSPPHGKVRMPAILICTGYTGTIETSTPFAPAFVRAGYAVLSIDYRSWGRSRESGDPHLIYPFEQMRDIRNGLTYLETLEFIDERQLFLFGVSFGGGNVLAVAATDPRVAGVVSLSGVTDGERWLRSMRAGWDWNEFIDKIRKERQQSVLSGVDTFVQPTRDIMVASPERNRRKGHDPSLAVPLRCADEIMTFKPWQLTHLISPRGVMLICGDDDPVVPSEQSHLAYENAKQPKRLVVLHADSHYEAYEEHRSTIESSSVEFFNECTGHSAI
jgi:pimeloyl-ACP methyl ester carboxylesterase